VNKLLQRPSTPWIISTVIAAALLGGALLLPLWKLELVAPQYPTGLVMRAYGYKFVDDPATYYDDVREINELNHYIGMAPIKEVNEMKIFIPGVAALILSTVVAGFIAWKGRLARGLIVAGYWFMPLFFVVDLQYWLYHFGHTMDPEAALNTGDFTPKVWGTTKVWNFHSETRFEMGFYLMVLAALVMTFGPPLIERMPRLYARFTGQRTPAERESKYPRGIHAAVMLVAMLAIGAAAFASQAQPARAQDEGALTLQQRIDNAAPDDILVVEGGAYHERIRVDKAISLVGRGWPIIDGDGQGDVVTITADDAVISGFEIRGSGRAVSQEPAAIKLLDVAGTKITGNRLRASHFGVHATGVESATISDNDIRVGEGLPQERRGHAIYLWEAGDTTVLRNTIREAADGIHLEFAHDNLIVENSVTDSRYALHLMYANKNTIVGNVLRDNLSGAVLMFSHDLIVKQNEFSSNRRGATGAGMLLKDNDNIFVEANRFERNKYGMLIEGAPQSLGATAILRKNVVALNDTGIGITSNSPITFVENAMIDNLVQVKATSGAGRALGDHGGGVATGGTSGEDSTTAPRGAVWASNGRGNYWSDYRGFDENGDGVGDQPYQPRPAFAGRLDDNETLQFFQFTPAQQALDLAADMFPVYRYDAVIEDGAPLMRPPAGAGLESSDGMNVRLLGASFALFAISGASAVAIYSEQRRRPWRRAAASVAGLRHAAGR
jgi:nitrous oxidase accessory protein